MLIMSVALAMLISVLQIVSLAEVSFILNAGYLLAFEAWLIGYNKQGVSRPGVTKLT